MLEELATEQIKLLNKENVELDRGTEKLAEEIGELNGEMACRIG